MSEQRLPTLAEIQAERERRAKLWRPRDYQLPLWEALTKHNFLRADVAAHRRWGKDDLSLNWTNLAARRRIGNYWHMLPEANQAKKAIWDAINPHTGKRRIYEAFGPPETLKVRNNDMHIELPNGSTWQVVGSDNYDSLVGSSPIGIVFSEWSLAKPEAWSFLRPILLENGGWAIFIWTPRGRNHAVRAFESRKEDPTNWFTLQSPVTDTKVFSQEQLDRELRELVDETGSQEEGEARYRSEYMVDFNVATPGAYYGRLMDEAEKANPTRITSVPHDPTIKVDTAWDLGIDDYTAIWFFQQVGREVRVIDYFETSGEGLPSIVSHMTSTHRRNYLFGTHHLPHDIMVRELATGLSRYETLSKLGLRNISVGQQNDPEERINATRQLIPLCFFDKDRAALGIDRLTQYAKKWNKSMKVWGGPKHDQHSHGAEAFGEFAMSRRGASQPKLRVVSNNARIGSESWLG
jgi:phage terminase large subunit